MNKQLQQILCLLLFALVLLPTKLYAVTTNNFGCVGTISIAPGERKTIWVPNDVYSIASNGYLPNCGWSLSSNYYGYVKLVTQNTWYCVIEGVSNSGNRDIRLNFSGNSTIGSNVEMWEYTGYYNIQVESSNVLVSQMGTYPESISIEVGKETGILELIAPINASNKKVSWESEDPDIASVTPSSIGAQVKAKKMGTTKIICKATDGSGKYATCPVEVIAKNGKFNAKNAEGIDMLYHIISQADKTCALGGISYSETAIDKKTSGKIVVPQKAEGYTVIEIGVNAFKDCSSITSVEIPSTVKKIRSGAFCDCTSLSQILGISNIEYVEPYTFSKTPWYDSLPDGEIYLGRAYFRYKGKMPENTTIKVKEGTKSISDYAFWETDGDRGVYGYNDNLVALEIPASVNTIGYDDAHWDDEKGYYWDDKGPRPFYSGKIQSIKIAEGNKYYYAPEGCNAIVERSTGIMIAASNTTVIPSSVRAIASHAFYGLDELATLIIPDNVEIFGGVTSCSNLSLLYIGKGVRVIRSSYGNRKLNSIVVDGENKYYDSRNDCNAIIEKKSATLITGCANTIIPSSVEVIYNLAFKENGKTYDIPNIVIPDNVKKICNAAFSNQTNLKSVVIGKNVQVIEGYAFKISDYQNNLMSVYSLNDYPTEIDEMAFGDKTYKQGVLYVPTGSKINYSGTKGWNKFANIVEFDPSNFDPSTLGIHDVTMDADKDAPVYNLFGRKLAQPKKGINIINGRKVIVK